MRNGTKMFQKLQMLQDLSSDRIRHGLEPRAYHLKKVRLLCIVIHNNLKILEMILLIEVMKIWTCHERICDLNSLGSWYAIHIADSIFKGITPQEEPY
jgi:hypothetical protein